MIKLVIFDFDGTLFDTEPIHELTRREFLSTLPFSNSLKAKDLLGKSVLEVVTKMFKDNNYDIDPYQASIIYFDRVLEHFVNQNLKPNKGVVQVLEYCQNHNIKCAIASSSMKFYLEKAIRINNLSNYFDYILGFDDVKHAKPEPDLFLKALELTNTNASNAVVIEDALSGIIASNKANIYSIGYDNPSDIKYKQDLTKASMIIHSFDELLDFLKENS